MGVEEKLIEERISIRRPSPEKLQSIFSALSKEAPTSDYGRAKLEDPLPGLTRDIYRQPDFGTGYKAINDASQSTYDMKMQAQKGSIYL